MAVELHQAILQFFKKRIYETFTNDIEVPRQYEMIVSVNRTVSWLVDV